MLRSYIFIIFIISSVTLLAQNDTDLMYLGNDSIRQQYDSAMKDPHIFRPRHLEISERDAIKMADRMPAFAVYRDTYFVTGVPLDEKISENSADVTFQLSIRQRLTRSILPFKSFLYLTYTQKSFWNIYAQSSPFRDTNYNPGVGLGKYILYKDRVVGAAFVQLKHESNGRDEEESRSWNYLSLSDRKSVV